MDDASTWLQAYPNPNAGSFLLQLGERQGPLVANLINALGETIWTARYPANTGGLVNVNTNVAPGTYQLQLSGRDKVRTIRLVIAR